MLIWTGSAQRSPKSFLFLDRDGIVNRDSPNYIKHWKEVELYPDALEALRLLKERDVAVLLISNQSGLGRGIIAWDDFWDLHERMVAAIREEGGDLMAALFCPHRPDEGCTCRKPAPGMILTASRLFSIPVPSCFMVGDRRKDAEAMANAGGRGVLVDRSGSFPFADPSGLRSSSFPVYPDLLSAVQGLSWRDAVHA